MLLERDRELSELGELVGAAPTEGGKVVLVRGEAGIGKTTLITEFARTVGDEADVLWGVCDDLLTPEALGVLWDIARDEPSLRAPLESGDRMAVMQQLLDLLSRSLRPTVLVFEDTHWADEATLDVIRYVGRRISRTNGLLILTYRDGEVDYEHPLRNVIGDLPPDTVTRMRLQSLSVDALRPLFADSDLDLEEVRTLTGGNPLFVTEVLDSGVAAVPTSVQDSVLARASRLTPQGRAVLDVASVVPGDADLGLIEAVTGSDSAGVTECVRMALLSVAGDTIRFHHELTRRAVESALSAPERKRLNAAVLAAYDDKASLSRLAHHAREAGDVVAIVTYVPGAAREAMAVQSYREAVAHFRSLEPYLDEFALVERAGIVDGWARSEFFTDSAEVLQILPQAIVLYRETGDEVALARALTFAVRTFEYNGRPDLADASASEALEIVERHPSLRDRAGTHAQIAWLAMMRSDFPEAVDRAERALQLAEEAGDEPSAASALNTKGVSIQHTGRDDGSVFLIEARRRAQVEGDSWEEARALVNLVEVYLMALDLQRAAATARKAIEVAARLEVRGLEAYAQAQLAAALLDSGEWSLAEDAASVAATAFAVVTKAYATWVYALLYTRQGRTEAPTQVNEAWASAVASKELQYLCPSAVALAEHSWYQGVVDDATVGELVGVLEEAIAKGGQPWYRGLLAFWLWKLGVLDRVADVPRPYRLLINEGRVGEAAAEFEQHGVPHEQALMLMHGDDAQRLQALSILDQLGAEPLASRLRSELREAGVSVPRRSSDTVGPRYGTLTERQSEVLELLGDGLSNTEIADRLFVSPRTVEHHVAAILSKLDATSRHDAVTRAQELDLIAAR